MLLLALGLGFFHGVLMCDQESTALGQPWCCFSRFLDPSWFSDLVLGRPKAHWAKSMSLWSTVDSPNTSSQHGVLKQKLILRSPLEAFVSLQQKQLCIDLGWYSLKCWQDATV